MHISNNQQPDHVILLLLAQNQEDAWPYLYDKYASMMYGIVYNMTGDEAKAAEILTEIFLTLKQKKMLSRVQNALCHSLVRHTHKLTLQHLKKLGLKPISLQTVNGNYPIINELYFELNTLNETEIHSDVHKKEILTSLRLEFNSFRNITNKE